MSDQPQRVALARPQAGGSSAQEPHDFTDAQVEEYREQDRYLPIANVARIMKESLPPTAKIAKESKECIQECVSEFISFVTSEASERCLDGKRKTLNGEDVLEALTALGFDNYAATLKVYLAKYRMSQPVKPKRASSNRAKAQTGAAKGLINQTESDEDGEANEYEDEDEEEGSDDGGDEDDGAPAAFFAVGQAEVARNVRSRLADEDDDHDDDDDESEDD